MNLQLLKDELAHSVYEAMDNETAAAALNILTITQPRACPISELNAMADTLGVSATLRVLDRKTDEQLAAKFGIQGDAVDQLRGLIFAALGLFDARYSSVDFREELKAARFAQVVNGLRSFGVITSDADRDALLSLGTESVPFTQIVGRAIDFADVARARAELAEG